MGGFDFGSIGDALASAAGTGAAGYLSGENKGDAEAFRRQQVLMNGLLRTKALQVQAMQHAKDPLEWAKKTIGTATQRMLKDRADPELAGFWADPKNRPVRDALDQQIGLGMRVLNGEVPADQIDAPHFGLLLEHMNGAHDHLPGGLADTSANTPPGAPGSPPPALPFGLGHPGAEAPELGAFTLPAPAPWMPSRTLAPPAIPELAPPAPSIPGPPGAAAPGADILAAARGIGGIPAAPSAPPASASASTPPAAAAPPAPMFETPKQREVRLKRELAQAQAEAKAKAAQTAAEAKAKTAAAQAGLITTKTGLMRPDLEAKNKLRISQAHQAQAQAAAAPVKASASTTTAAAASSRAQTDQQRQQEQARHNRAAETTAAANARDRAAANAQRSELNGLKIAKAKKELSKSSNALTPDEKVSLQGEMMIATKAHHDIAGDVFDFDPARRALAGQRINNLLAIAAARRSGGAAPPSSVPTPGVPYPSGPTRWDQIPGVKAPPAAAAPALGTAGNPRRSSAAPAPPASTVPPIPQSALGTIKKLIATKRFDQEMAHPAMQNPTLRQQAKAGYKRITGRDWTPGR